MAKIVDFDNGAIDVDKWWIIQIRSEYSTFRNGYRLYLRYMDFENVFYVILAIIYILSRVLKAKKQPEPTETSDDQPTGKGSKPVSFEDLLKEFGRTEEVESEPVEEIKPVEKEEKRDHTPSYDRRFSDDEAKSIYEKSIAQAEKFEHEGEQPDGKPLIFKEFKPYAEESDKNEFVEEIKDMFNEGDGGKKAIVLSEILNRKY
ncbi:MAG: hypothetical protein RJQ09_02060 [Cyclobacteriaceae bacterium]